jgi:hypothetical protein
VIEQCSVPACPREGTEEVDRGVQRLCMHHALSWDANEDERISQLHELQHGDPNTSMDDVWAEHFNQWCGAQVPA